MDDALDDILNDGDYDVAESAAISAVRELEVPTVTIKTRRLMVEVDDFDQTQNIMNYDIREAFRTERVFEETCIFTRPIATTNTMEGYLSNVSFHERDLITQLIPDSDIIMYRCNFGKSVYAGYTEPLKKRVNNLGRKKKGFEKKPRKRQGSGIDFNSQVTFVVRSTLSTLLPDGTVPADARVYKFKVFRTGKLQLPGVHQHLIDDVITCTKKITAVLNTHLHPGETNPARIASAINVNPVMKNYKFIVKMPPGTLIDLSILKQIVADGRTHDLPAAPPHPPVCTVKYTRQDTKLSAKFATPINRKPKKKTRVNIFMRGKINILGAFYASATRQICEYLHWVFAENYAALIVSEGDRPPPIVPSWVENIARMTDDEYAANMAYFSEYTIPRPTITDEDYADILTFLNW